jgi:nucleotide-binding universal stress UspA family protein
MFKRLLLAADGSEQAQRAARMVRELASGAEPAAVCIVAPFAPIPEYLGEPYREQAAATRRFEAEAAAKSLREELSEFKGAVDVQVLEGPAAQAILAVSETHRSDLILIGSQGLGTLSHLLAENDANPLERLARCPVMVVR